MVILCGFLRHFNAVRQAKGGTDFDRKLSKKGENQAKNLKLPFTPDLVVCSSALRAILSAALATALPASSIITLDSLYDPINAENFDAMYDQHGDIAAPYLTDERATEMLAMLKTAAMELKDIFLANPGKKILVIGHAVLLNYLAYYMFGENITEDILKVEIGTGEGFMVDGSYAIIQF